MPNSFPTPGVTGSTLPTVDGGGVAFTAAAQAIQAAGQAKNDAALAGPLLPSMRAIVAQGRFMLTLPVDYTLADGAVLYTVPALQGGARVAIERAYWEVVTAWTGGVSSAIGIASSNASYATKGDLLGGAAGDVASGLTVGFKGTVGAKAASQGVIVLVQGDTIVFNRVTSVFTAGSGLLQIPCSLVPSS